MNYSSGIIGFLLVTCFLISSCSPVSQTALTKRFKTIELKLHDHTGFMLYDPETKKELASFQSHQYFTPASNTKVLTLYTSLMVLGDSIPSIQYVIHGDSLIFRGMGDPSFLYNLAFDSQQSFNFLKSQNQKIFLSQQNFYSDALGPGWAWDDTQYTYSVERSALPLFGNFFSVDRNGSSLKINPHQFSYELQFNDTLTEAKVIRALGSNKTLFHPGRSSKRNQHWEIPFVTSAQISAQLLADTLKKPVIVLTKDVDFRKSKIIKNTPLDSLYKVMMQESDNFIAEQLLLVNSAVLSDSLNSDIAIRYMQKNHFQDLPDPLIWVDGSGLSRYNLFTPASIVKVWEKIYSKVPRERLFNLLAIGGKTGTIKNYYKNDSLSKLPYIYGKTGTLSNNHSLSGYLLTKKGRVLIFSFMNSNYISPTREVRTEMERLLKDIYLHY